MGHYVAVCIPVKISDRKALHMSEHLVPYDLQSPLGYHSHGAVVKKHAYNAHKVYGAHYHQSMQKSAENGILSPYKRHYIVIYQYLQEKR